MVGEGWTGPWLRCKVSPGKDGKVRVGHVKTTLGEMMRPVQRLHPLEVSGPLEASGPSEDRVAAPAPVRLKVMVSRSGRLARLPSRFLSE
ncbi:hypothetical protein PR048_000253 [Dryococelus australis]|uniref:DUF5641 domain-containing protein n=1 Tax=Dryococelus australis TaxID=614101 RepID=A0ABQ9IEA6_9NEOP|nr:hypothetical protein PR048_000253 [Dryococelus australis]